MWVGSWQVPVDLEAPSVADVEVVQPPSERLPSTVVIVSFRCSCSLNLHPFVGEVDDVADVGLPEPVALVEPLRIVPVFYDSVLVDELLAGERTCWVPHKVFLRCSTGIEGRYLIFRWTLVCLSFAEAHPPGPPVPILSVSELGSSSFVLGAAPPFVSVLLMDSCLLDPCGVCVCADSDDERVEGSEVSNAVLSERPLSVVVGCPGSFECVWSWDLLWEKVAELARQLLSVHGVPGDSDAFPVVSCLSSCQFFGVGKALPDSTQLVVGERSALDTLEHKVPCQSIRHLALRRVTPDLTSVHIVLVVFPEGLDVVLLHKASTYPLHEFEPIAVHLECIVALVLVPLLLDLCLHSRVARKLGFALLAGTSTSSLVSLEARCHDVFNNVLLTCDSDFPLRRRFQNPI